MIRNYSTKEKDKEANIFFGEVLTAISKTTSKEWSKIAEKQALSVFKEAYKHVPAYSEFITASKITAKSVTSQEVFSSIPKVTKKNYLRKFKWESLCKKDGLQKSPLVMTSTSGSTGEPFYFPRTAAVDIQSSVYHQLFLTTSKLPKNTSTLVIDCFGMGVWIGGLITYQAFSYISARGTPLTVITPGINAGEIFKALKHIAPKYDQVIICGYPPFIKDIVDGAEGQGINLKKISLKIIFAAEGFSETFREYIASKAGIKNLYRDTMNIYGSADLGTMAQETPMSIFIRRLALSNQKLYARLFGQGTRLPTFAQYIPSYITFEEEKGSILCTGDNVLPLVRYEIGDNGGALTYAHVEKILQEEGYDLTSLLTKEGLIDTKNELPFVYVYERSDFSASFYGALIYPEFIKKGLATKGLESVLTGKFTMSTKNDTNENQYLEINIELQHGVKSSAVLSKKTVTSICRALTEQSAEYKKIAESLGKKALPKVVFFPHGHTTHFQAGAKQKWVKKI